MLGQLDLSIVTHKLVNQLKAYKARSDIWDDPPNTTPPTTALTIECSGFAPDAARDLGGCQLSVYLFHVAIDKFYRNTYPTGGSAQRTPEHPMALTLYYLVSAFSDSDKADIDEQQAMSLALKFFHENPRITATVPISNRQVQLTFTFEPQTPDEIGRLWQAFSRPLRMSAVYRAAVVFLEPPGEPKIAEQVEEFTLEAVPAPILTTVDAPGSRATITIEGAGFRAGATEVVFQKAVLTATTGSPAAGQFRVVDNKTLEVHVPALVPPAPVTPAGTQPRGRILLMRAAPHQPTFAVWLVVS